MKLNLAVAVIGAVVFFGGQVLADPPNNYFPTPCYGGPGSCGMGNGVGTAPNLLRCIRFPETCSNGMGG